MYLPGLTDSAASAAHAASYVISSGSDARTSMPFVTAGSFSPAPACESANTASVAAPSLCSGFSYGHVPSAAWHDLMYRTAFATADATSSADTAAAAPAAAPSGGTPSGVTPSGGTPFGAGGAAIMCQINANPAPTTNNRSPPASAAAFFTR